MQVPVMQVTSDAGTSDAGQMLMCVTGGQSRVLLRPGEPSSSEGARQGR